MPRSGKPTHSRQPSRIRSVSPPARCRLLLGISGEGSDGEFPLLSTGFFDIRLFLMAGSFRPEQLHPEGRGVTAGVNTGMREGDFYTFPVEGFLDCDHHVAAAFKYPLPGHPE